jgi:hypothetical protein
MGVDLIGVHPIGVCLRGVYLAGVHAMGGHLMSGHLMGVHLIDGYPGGVYLMSVNLSGRNCYLDTSPQTLFRHITVLGGIWRCVITLNDSEEQELWFQSQSL